MSPIGMSMATHIKPPGASGGHLEALVPQQVRHLTFRATLAATTLNSYHRIKRVDDAFDIIGDVHGHADALIALLRHLGYGERNGAWRHSGRRVIFVGDFIDRGPKQVESVMIARRMVDAGSALAVMGNHDFNAVAWYLPDPSNPVDHFRSHSFDKGGAKNRQQHAQFLREVEGHPLLHKEIIDWFLTLPLWLDLTGLRVVHACWHSRFMEYLAPRLLPGARLSVDLMQGVRDTEVKIRQRGEPANSPRIGH